MTIDAAMLILAVATFLLTWTGTTIAVMLYLTGRFRRMEATFNSSFNAHRRHVDQMFHLHDTRTQRLELKIFGFSPIEGDPGMSNGSNGGSHS